MKGFSDSVEIKGLNEDIVGQMKLWTVKNLCFVARFHQEDEARLRPSPAQVFKNVHLKFSAEDGVDENHFGIFHEMVQQADQVARNCFSCIAHGSQKLKEAAGFNFIFVNDQDLLLSHSKSRSPALKVKFMDFAQGRGILFFARLRPFRFDGRTFPAESHAKLEVHSV